VEHQGTVVLDKGTRLGKYEIERLVGVGSMGAVYEGRHRETGERFAIKVLSPVLAAVPAARARFLKEAKLTARVRHPHVIDVTDVGEDGGQSYLVMELLEGADLSSRLDGFGSLSAAETVDIMLPVCDAVAEAHANGVTHRDLKPSNIFLAIRDQKTHPVVLDFGIAKDEDAASIWDAAGAGPARRPVFAPYYLAPEQVIDHRAAGPASDQHALGVILYECLTGQPPYRGDSVEKLFRAIAAGNPISPSAREPDLPQGLDAIVLRALETDPSKRFDSVAALERALRPFASQSAAPEPGSYRRKPSSPAIEVEAATRSPYVRTLTPEVEALSGPWFEAAADAPQASAEDVALPALTSAGDPQPDAEPPLWSQPQPAARKLAGKRIWIGAVAGVAVSVLALVLVATRGSSSAAHRPQVTAAPPAEALVQVEPAAVKPPAAPPAEALVQVEPGAVKPSAALAPPAPVPPAPPLPVAEEPPAEPTPVPAVAPPASAVPAAPARARTRKSVDRPRTRTSDGIRMHNGVPLLD
jgi:eukaryotic-like serine/threonine-protein kinase